MNYFNLNSCFVFIRINKIKWVDFIRYITCQPILSLSYFLLPFSIYSASIDIENLLFPSLIMKGKTLMKKFTNEKLKSIIPAFLSLVFLYGLMQLFGITCPIKYFFGVSCPGCGMTRACLSVLRLDFAKAFYYHPLFWVPPLFITIFLLKNKINIKIYKFFLFTIVGLFVIVYFIRLISGSSSVVTCNFKEGLLYKLIQYFT